MKIRRSRNEKIVHLQRKKNTCQSFWRSRRQKTNRIIRVFRNLRKNQRRAVLVLNGNGETYSNYVHSKNIHSKTRPYKVALIILHLLNPSKIRSAIGIQKRCTILQDKHRYCIASSSTSIEFLLVNYNLLERRSKEQSRSLLLALDSIE